MGFGKTFSGFQLSTRIVLIASFVCGLLSLVGLSLTDLGVNLTLGSWDPKPDWLTQFNAEWLHGHSYIPNILAAITGFLIGVPIALVVLATFTAERDDKAAADRVNAISQIAWNQFRDAITTLCSPQRIDALREGADRIQRVHDETWQGLNIDFERLSAEEFQQVVAFAQQQSETWEDAIESLRADVGAMSDLTLQWFAAVRDWNTLDQYVRLQRLERGLPWFHRELDALLQERMIADKHPMRRVFEAHDANYAPAPGQPDNMASALSVVAVLGRLGRSQKDFNRIAREHLDRFPTSRVGTYHYTLMDVAHHMGMLYAFVQQIDRSGWPAHAPENPPLAS